MALGAVNKMPTAAEESADPTGAERTYVSCSEWLRSKALQLKKQPPFDIVHDENISYGYRRNLLGIRSYALVITCLAVSSTVAAFLFGRQPVIEALLILMLGLYFGLAVSKAGLRRGADNYSHRLLSAVDAIPKETTPSKQKISAKAAQRP